MDQVMALTKDETILGLMALLHHYQKRDAANDVYEMVSLLGSMELKIDTVMQELNDTRKQLRDMQEKQEQKGFHTVLRTAVKNLEQQCIDMKERLFEIKSEVKTKAGAIVAETRQKGREALYKVTEFLNIREKLEQVRHMLRKSIMDVDKTIERITSFGSGMREASEKALDTILNFIGKSGKEKSNKKRSKTEAILKPWQAKHKLLAQAEKCVDGAICRLEKLAEHVKTYQQKKETNDVPEERSSDYELAVPISEPEYRYGAELFESKSEADLKEAVGEMTDKKCVLTSEIKR